MKMFLKISPFFANDHDSKYLDFLADDANQFPFLPFKETKNFFFYNLKKLLIQTTDAFSL